MSSSIASATMSRSALSRSFRARERFESAQARRNARMEANRVRANAECERLANVCANDTRAIEDLENERTRIATRGNRRRTQLRSKFLIAESKFLTARNQKDRLMTVIRRRQQFGLPIDVDTTTALDQFINQCRKYSRDMKFRRQQLERHEAYHPRRLNVVNKKLRKKRAQRVRNMGRHARAVEARGRLGYMDAEH